MAEAHFAQDGYRVRLEWGAEGVAALADCAVLIVVDVLSFSTSVDVALGRGGHVLPLPWRDGRAAAAARGVGAVLAGERGWTLRPSSLLDLPAGTLLALPSPNGATLCAAAAGTGATVFAGCLRNAAAVANAALANAGDRPVGVIPAGERWGVSMTGTAAWGPLRPCAEDLLGAGAIVAAVADAVGPEGHSPEAALATQAFRHASGDIGRVLRDCASGRELAAKGHAADVGLAAQLAVSEIAPVLRDGVLAPSGER